MIASMNPAAPSPPPAGRSGAAGWSAAALVVATTLAYLPALRAGFVWDDAAHLTAPALRSWAGLGRIWSEPGATQQYYPLLHSLFWLEHRLWGDAALGYHAANLALHATAAVLAGRLLQRLAVPGAWFAAALFALHPVQVESVAWISEQKNTLSAVCALAAALRWLRFDADRQRRHYWLAFGLFLLALLGKTVVAVLPAALLVLVWWRRGRLDWRQDVLPLLPWFALGVIAGLFTAGVERHLIGAGGAAHELPAVQRVLLAGRVPWFYLGKLLWPADLTFIYPRWTLASTPWSQWLPFAAAVGVTISLWSLRQRTRGPLAAWLLFGGGLFPVLGFFNVYPFIYSFVADHFQYLACLAPFAAVAAAGAAFPRRFTRAAGASAVTLLAVLSVLTWRQTRRYHDAEALYRATVERNPGAWMAWNNLGRELLADPARRAEALACFARAVALRPDYPEALNNLGLGLAQTGRAAEGVPRLEHSVRLQPASAEAHNNLGIALAGSGRTPEALRAFRMAAALNPTLPNIRENWGRALLLLGRAAEAREQFAHAARLRAATSAGAGPTIRPP